MKEMTQQHLINAYGGESQAHMRYLHFADQTEEEHFQNVERLFRAIAYAEQVHAGDHYRELRHLDGGFVANSMAAFGPGDTKKNLALAIHEFVLFSVRNHHIDLGSVFLPWNSSLPAPG